MRFFSYLRSVILGWIVTVLALIIAVYFISVLLVFSQFPGNAVFPVECAVVFGSAVHRNTEPGPGIERRTETAVKLLEEGSLERLIFTGGLGEGNRLSEARVMRNVALRLGVEPEIIRMEEGARSTWQSVKFVQLFVQDCESTVAISDRYHLARIRFMAWRYGLDWSVHPSEKLAGSIFEIRAVLREAMGILIYAFVRLS